MSSLTCLPRFATRRRPERRTRGHELARVAAMLGTPLMPWQQLVADVGLELDESGRPAYREVVVTVPRQNGKTTLMLAWELHRCLLWTGNRQVVVYGSTDGNAARKKLLLDQLPILEHSELAATLLPKDQGVRKAAGQESFNFRNGSRLEVMGSSESALHGRTIDMAVADEVWDDLDDRREQAVLPAMATRPEGQYLVISTAGTASSVYLRRKVDHGRESVGADVGSGTAYFEWSAPEDADPDDPAVWWACMPALGLTISEQVVSHARATMSADEFRRAYLNQWTGAEERVIPPQLWNEVCTDAAPDGELTFAVDCNPERSAAAIAVCDADGRCELVDYRLGVGWLAARAAELARKYKAPVVLDVGGPAGSVTSELEAAGALVVKYNAQDLVHACGAFYDAVADATVQVRTIKPLDEAVDAARKRQLGDRWAWSRKSSATDISPLVALTLAYFHATSSGARPKREWFGGYA